MTIKKSTELNSNFLENSLCDYITDLEKKEHKCKNHIDKRVLAWKISDAKHQLGQALDTAVRHQAER